MMFMLYSEAINNCSVSLSDTYTLALILFIKIAYYFSKMRARPRLSVPIMGETV